MVAGRVGATGNVCVLGSLRDLHSYVGFGVTFWGTRRKGAPSQNQTTSNVRERPVHIAEHDTELIEFTKFS